MLCLIVMKVTLIERSQLNFTHANLIPFFLNIDLNALINVFYMYFVGHTKKRMLLEQGYDNDKKVS